MQKILFGTSLLILCSIGCMHQQQLHQTLLLQENRRLEEALYVTHAQLSDVQRENEGLRAVRSGNVNGNGSMRDSRFNVPGSGNTPSDEPEFEMPEVLLPNQSGTSSVPMWKPRR